MSERRKNVQELERRIEESYNHIKPYLKGEDQNKELREMCKSCDVYCGKEHDYLECRERPCFRFWLCYEYMRWAISFGG